MLGPQKKLNFMQLKFMNKGKTSLRVDKKSNERFGLSKKQIKRGRTFQEN